MSEIGTSQQIIQAAQAGDDKAQCELAMMYEHGIGCPKDNELAARWYQSAAVAGNGFAAYKLALLYESGALGEINLPQTVTWLRRAADTGLSEAQYKLANMLEQGRGIEANAVEAAVWFGKAGEQGIVDAQYRLGMMYDYGLGVKKDLKAAARLYAQASQSGNANAQYALGVLFAAGEGGVERNEGEAARLFKLAAEAGHSKAKQRVERGKLTPEQLKQADAADKKKTGSVVKPATKEQEFKDFMFLSVKQALVISVILGILVLTPIGDIISEGLKWIGWPLGIGLLVLAIASVFGLSKFFAKKTKVDWFAVATGFTVLAIAILVVGIVGFGGFQFKEPDANQEKQKKHSQELMKKLGGDKE